jgi:hypothetical protein
LGAIRRAPQLADQVGELQARLDALGVAHHDTRLVADHGVSVAAAASSRLDAHLPRLDTLDARTQGEAEKLAVLHRHQLAIDRLERKARIAATQAWLSLQPVPPDVLVSVVLPTRDRAGVVADAVASVQAQRYPNWELVAVNDGSSDATPEVLDALAADEPRLRVAHTKGVGVCAARNVALDLLSGDLVVYLDDDNLMDPGWLHAVVWAFGRWPDHVALYGARLIDDADLLFHHRPGGMPDLQFEPYHRPTLRQGNFIDMGVLAHRRSLPVRFDPDLTWFGDWDLALQATASQPPLELPVIASHYRTDQEVRLSGAEDAYSHPAAQAEAAAVRVKWAGR